MKTNFILNPTSLKNNATSFPQPVDGRKVLHTHMNKESKIAFKQKEQR